MSIDEARHRPRCLVFGASGAIGAPIADRFRSDGWEVLGTSRAGGGETLGVDPFGDSGMDALDSIGPVRAAVWAQGANANDSVAGLDLDVHEEVLRANVVFVSATLARLLDRGVLEDGARLVVLSSIWQALARQEKFSYTVSKAALGGLVHSAAVDLAARGMLVNAVLPSVTDTPMTRSMLSPEQVDSFAANTRHERLTSVHDVTSLVCYLCSDANTGVTGQSIAVDLGYSIGRLL